MKRRRFNPPLKVSTSASQPECWSLPITQTHTVLSYCECEDETSTVLAANENDSSYANSTSTKNKDAGVSPSDLSCANPTSTRNEDARVPVSLTKGKRRHRYSMFLHAGLGTNKRTCYEHTKKPVRSTVSGNSVYDYVLTPSEPLPSEPLPQAKRSNIRSEGQVSLISTSISAMNALVSYRLR